MSLECMSVCTKWSGRIHTGMVICAVGDRVTGVSAFPIVPSHVPQSFCKHRGITESTGKQQCGDELHSMVKQSNPAVDCRVSKSLVVSTVI